MSWPNRQDRARIGASEGSSGAPERYEILGELGQGGMSVVFRARDKQLGRDVAVKVLHDFLARQPDARKRFHREAVAVARLRHPGIVEIHDYSGPDAEDAYIVCELIEGETLRALVDRHGPLPHPELAVLVVAELVRALRHAHEQGIVHRDVKPENVMITPRGQLKLMDFGIAQIMEGATKLTATGTLLGSPAHMAPEVIDGKPSDHRSDIFSVGTMLYWLATGALPFQAPNPSALFRLILEGTYEPAQMLNPKIGNGLARVIDQALASDPEARYQDISELQDDLQKELEEVGLVPADSLVKDLLADPPGFAAAWRPKLIEALVARGHEALAEGNVARAMDRFNRVLAVEPEHPEVARRVSLIGRRARFNRRARRAAVALAVAAGVAGLGAGAVALWPPPTPAPTTPPAPALARAEPPAPTGAAQDPAPAPAAPTPEAPVAPAPAPTRAVGRPEPKPLLRAPPPRAPAATVLSAAPAPRATLPAPEAPAAEVKAPTQATLRIRIGNGWGNIRINGKLERSEVFDGDFRLTPGRHVVEVFRSDGRHRPRTVEVDPEGRLFELSASGRRTALAGGELSFRMPAKGGVERGWIPAESEATARPEPSHGG